MHRDEQFRRVGDLAEAFAGHLEDSQLGSRAEPVLDAAQNPVRASVVAFELKDHIHDVFQDLRPGDVAFFGDVADQNDRDARLFGKTQKYCRHLFDLGHRARSRINCLREHCLNRVNNHQVRLCHTRLRDHILNQCLAVNLTVGGITSQAVGTHLDLPQTFLSGDVQGPQGRASERNLKGKSGLAYPRLSADQNERPLHDTAAENPVNFPVIQGKTGFRAGVNLIQFLRLAASSGHIVRHGWPSGHSRHNFLFDHSVPLSASGAATHPFGIFIAAIRAEPDCFLFHARSYFFTQVSQVAICL